MSEAVERRYDVVTAAPLARLAATLDHVQSPGGVGTVPPLGHWLFHLPDARQSVLGADGHPARSGALAAIRQPRRMWAGSRLTFPGKLQIGDAIMRTSTVTTMADKGAMTFATLRHDIMVGDTCVVTEEQDLVFLPARTSAEQAPAKTVDVPPPDHVRKMTADEALLLRFSALTFNAHRIHYDRNYACDVEHYAGLVVHGPLLATLLMDHALRHAPDAHVTAFAFRARSPVIVGAPFDLCQAGSRLWVRNRDGIVAMTAEIAFA